MGGDGVREHGHPFEPQTGMSNLVCSLQLTLFSCSVAGRVRGGRVTH
jgi:hypothetical protein